MVRLRLVQLNNGRSKVIACDESGEQVGAGNLLIFHRDGSIERCSGVSSDIGFSLDDYARITIRGI